MKKIIFALILILIMSLLISGCSKKEIVVNTDVPEIGNDETLNVIDTEQVFEETITETVSSTESVDFGEVY